MKIDSAFKRLQIKYYGQRRELNELKAKLEYSIPIKRIPIITIDKWVK